MNVVVSCNLSLRLCILFIYVFLLFSVHSNKSSRRYGRHYMVYKLKVNVVFNLEQAAKVQRGSRGIALLFP
jgi:hypothetical protein